MKTLKEVKKHFKNAKEVRCLSDGKIYKLGKIKIDKNVFLFFNEFLVKDKYNQSSIILSNDNQLAEIISYKTLTGIKKAILDDYNKLFPVDNIKKEFITEEFKYLEKLICSDYEDFSISRICYYACKNTLEGHVVFSEFDSVFVFKYIKKIS